MLLRPIPADDKAWLDDRAGSRGADIAANLQGSLASISLGSQGALTTAIANDVRFDMVFAQQVNGLGRPGDVLFAISTTGYSPSVVNAAHVARLRQVSIVALTGRDGGELARLADVAIRVPADRVYEIQEHAAQSTTTRHAAGLLTRWPTALCEVAAPARLSCARARAGIVVLRRDAGLRRKRVCISWVRTSESD